MYVILSTAKNLRLYAVLGSFTSFRMTLFLRSEGFSNENPFLMYFLTYSIILTILHLDRLGKVTLAVADGDGDFTVRKTHICSH